LRLGLIGGVEDAHKGILRGLDVADVLHPLSGDVTTVEFRGDIFPEGLD
jgi:hypothetical protein